MRSTRRTLAGAWIETRQEVSMPSKSPKQRRLMAAAAHSRKFAKKVGVPMSVAKEFNKSDQRKRKRGKKK
jgi:hypothetical protein